MSMTGCKMTHIPYKGAGPALTELISGQVHVLFDNLPSSIGHIKGARIRAVANRALADPKMRERLAELGGRPIPGTPEDFAKVIQAEIDKWAKVVVSWAKVE
jgi:tripartite-type tricarboxylate transporter receptor subunit TctC